MNAHPEKTAQLKMMESNTDFNTKVHINYKFQAILFPKMPTENENAAYLMWVLTGAKTLVI